jgi:hypothetical protein
MCGMAAVISAGIVEGAARAGAFAAGRALLDAGAVTELESFDGGAGGLVADGDGEHDVWAGIRYRFLVGECDCADAEPAATSDEYLQAAADDEADPPGLCAHAVAVALAAIEDRLPWAAAPIDHRPLYPGEESDVPADGPVRIGPVQLPAGRRLPSWHDEARLWAASEPVSDAGRVWQALTDMHPGTGLVPILLGFLHRGHAGRPWDNEELGLQGDLAAVDRLDAAAVLAEQWAGSVPTAEELASEHEFAEMIAPFGEQFPGLARGQEQALTEAELTRALGWFGPARIGLVPASRPADVLALIGYSGTVNRYNTPEFLSAALRSWEDRFGAVLVEVGFSHIRLLARRPPRTLPDAQAVAAELWAFCDEFWPIDKPGTAVRDVGQIAEHILDIPIWSLWLD